MELFNEEELLEYVKYWGGDLSELEDCPRRRGRSLSAIIFYCLHKPDAMPKKDAWARTVKQAVTFLRDRLMCDLSDNARTFRTPECQAYFKQLLQGYLDTYGPIKVFQFRYQNWMVVDCQTMIDELWTIQSMLQNQEET